MRDSALFAVCALITKPVPKLRNSIASMCLLRSKTGRRGDTLFATWDVFAHCTVSFAEASPLVVATNTAQGFSLFLPTILLGMGYKGTKVQLMSVPPYAVAATMTVFIGWLADRTRWRGYCNMATSFVGCIGFAMLLATKNPHVQYAGTFLGAMGIYPTVSNTLSWASNNVEGVYKRGVMVGIVVGWGNMNGVVSSNIYMTPEKPRYWTGHGTVLAYMFLCLFGGSIFMHVMLRRENALRKAGKRDHWLEGKSEEDIRMMGDVRPDFIYTL